MKQEEQKDIIDLLEDTTILKQKVINGDLWFICLSKKILLEWMSLPGYLNPKAIKEAFVSFEW